jgi:hypothetical protein
MKAADSSETSMNFYQIIRRRTLKDNNPREELNFTKESKQNGVTKLKNKTSNFL